jgi:hypothetical protein
MQAMTFRAEVFVPVGTDVPATVVVHVSAVVPGGAAIPGGGAIIPADVVGPAFAVIESRLVAAGTEGPAGVLFLGGSQQLIRLALRDPEHGGQILRPDTVLVNQVKDLLLAWGSVGQHLLAG